jgi:6,7-dimethyl-8-ribityllumazine synthase
VLTVDTMQQAVDRTGGPEGDKGAEVTLAAIEMVQLLRELGT